MLDRCCGIDASFAVDEPMLADGIKGSTIVGVLNEMGNCG
jgi:hypothetical protein